LARILAGALGECVHVAGVLNFLRLAEEAGHHTEFLGPATPVRDFIGAIRETNPDIVAVSYRLTPEVAEKLLTGFWHALEEAGLSRGRKFCFGGTKPVAETAKALGFFDAVFTGEEPIEDIMGFLKGKPMVARDEAGYAHTMVERLRQKAPFPLIRHHFGVPAQDIEPTVEGIRKIAEAKVLDVISLGPDQDAQENFFHPERCDPTRKGAGGVPVRTEEDLVRLYEASRTGNFPLMRSYSGTDELIRYAEMLERTINNTWCATSVFWFNALDQRGPMSVEESIREHMQLMKWCGQRNIPVEANESHHWELRGGHDTVAVATAYIAAYIAKKMGVRDFIGAYMLHTPPQMSDRMDMAKMLAKIELVESLADNDFHVYRQTRSGLLSFPVDVAQARGQLGSSVYLQMFLKPDIVHVVAYCEADHAAGADEVIESCTLARQVIMRSLGGLPDITMDPVIKRRKRELVEEAGVLIEAIRTLGGHGVEDALCDPLILARAVRVGLLDAPNLKGNPHAAGAIVCRAVDGAIQAIDPQSGQVVQERERIDRISGTIDVDV